MFFLLTRPIGVIGFKIKFLAVGNFATSVKVCSQLIYGPAK